MFKKIKQNKKKLKTFKNSYKSIHNFNAEEMNGRCEDCLGEKASEYHAVYHQKGIPKKRMPKDSMVFGSKPSKY